ncbi:MAG: hypothetical protein JO134_01145 [Xanthobacteraceae bacterium]|nr:hypothetical protein [Xanthobacteraceae bacterium]
MIDWLTNFSLDIVGLLVIASMFGGFIKLNERGKGLVMFVINMPRTTQLFIAEAKKRLSPDGKLPTSKTSQDD